MYPFSFSSRFKSLRNKNDSNGKQIIFSKVSSLVFLPIFCHIITYIHIQLIFQRFKEIIQQILAIFRGLNSEFLIAGVPTRACENAREVSRIKPALGLLLSRSAVTALAGFRRRYREDHLCDIECIGPWYMVVNLGPCN